MSTTDGTLEEAALCGERKGAGGSVAGALCVCESTEEEVLVVGATFLGTFEDGSTEEAVLEKARLRDERR